MIKINENTKKEELIVHAENVCECIENINRVFTAAIDLLNGKYNGKEINKRFTNDLNKMFEGETIRCNGNDIPLFNITIYERWGDKVFSVYCHKRSYQFGGHTVYFDGEILSEETFWSTLYENGKLDTNKLAAAMKNTINANKARAYCLQDAVKHFEKYKAKAKKALEDYKNTLSKINPMFYETSNVMIYIRESEWEKKRKEKLGA